MIYKLTANWGVSNTGFPFYEEFVVGQEYEREGKVHVVTRIIPAHPGYVVMFNDGDRIILYNPNSVYERE